MIKKLFLAGLVALCASCSTDALNDSDFVAGDTFTDSNIRVMLIDTLTVETSTIKFDSIETSQTTRMLVGKYTDPVFGTVKSTSYIQLLPETYGISSEAVYDSLIFFLKYDNYYYNDTLQNSTVHLRQLTGNLKPEGDSFYNTSAIAFEDEDLGILNYAPRPLETDSLVIKMNDSLGSQLFQSLQEKLITNSDEFKDFFKGMAVLPDESDNGAIIGFSAPASGMRLYFTTSEESEQVQTYIDFAVNTVGTPTPFFNRITADEPIDYLKTLTHQEIDLNSADSGNQSFIQSGIGIATKIQFPHIKSVYDINGEGTLLDAVLKIKPTIGNYGDELLLRDSLSVFLVDQNNDLTEQLVSTTGTALQAILNRDNQEFNDIYYEIHLGSYIEKLLLTDRETGEALMLLPDNYNATVDRFVLNGSNNDDYPITLEIKYAIYNEDE